MSLGLLQPVWLSCLSGAVDRFCMPTLGLSRRSLWRALVLCCTATMLTACGLFGDKEDEELAPSELLEFESSFPVKRLWSAKLGEGTEFLRIGLSPAGDGNRVYAASYDGNVIAFDPQSGERIWRTELDAILSAGPGVGGGLVIVAGYDGALIALRAEDGSEAWRKDIAGEALARPLIKDDAVVVYTIDGRLRMYSTFDGAERWVVEQSSPALTLRGAAVPLIVGSSVIAGFDNGRLIASNLADGTQLWEAILAPPSGRSDLERLADVDGAMAAVGQDVYASGYQGRVASLAAESGQVLWGRDVSAFSGLVADWNNVYVNTDEGELVALLRRNGNEVWRQDALLRREPTGPAAFNTTVVVGDFEGYVHFFANSDGRPVARVRVGKSMISGSPVVVGSVLLVQSESGTLQAFGLPEPEPRGDAPDVAAEDAQP